MRKPVWPRTVNLCHPLMKDCVLFLPMNEGTGPKLQDWSGHYAVSGFTNFINCAGTYYAQAANNTIDDITTQDIGIAAFVKFSSDVNQYILSKRDGGAAGYIAFYSATYDSLMFLMEDGNGDYWSMRGDVATLVDDGNWHHVAFIIDRSSQSNCEIFVDDVALSMTYSGTLADVVESITNAAVLTLGATSAAGSVWESNIRSLVLAYPADIMAANEMGAAGEISNLYINPYVPSAWPNSEDYWLCDDGSGVTVTGSVNDLTLTSASAWATEPLEAGPRTAEIEGATWAGGDRGTCLSFDGSAYISCGADADLNITGAITLATRIKTSQTSTQLLICKMDGSNDGYNIAILNEHGFMRINAQIKEGGVDIVDGTWHDVCCVYDGGTIYVYIDGVLDGSASVGSVVMSTTAVLEIGRYYSENLMFEGDMEYAAVWNRALSAGEVRQLARDPFQTFRR